jgi:hypothetical protein
VFISASCLVIYQPFIPISVDLIPSNVKNSLVTINTTFETRRTHDETCYTNGQTILRDFGQLRGIGSAGETQNNLLINYVGSDKLLERIDSANT